MTQPNLAGHSLHMFKLVLTMQRDFCHSGTSVSRYFVRPGFEVEGQLA